LKQLTRNRVLGIPQEHLAEGEDAGFVSHDGLHVPARLYLPAPELGFEGKRPVVFYIHGGPQGQERPDFTWFSMPLIQFLTLNGLAVFVPNVRGSHGYGLDYVKRVDRDWGGLDRLDHVVGLESLKGHPRVDASRAGVVGRSYGGYMTLMQVGMHPDLWSAAVDMFGPFNLLSFLERIPETWKPYFHIALGHPERDRDFLVERSPSTHLHQLACPMLVIQGRNDPRVVAAESEDLVRTLQGQGKDVSLLLFENEGHDVTKFENKVRAYTEITRFFAEKLGA
jgi:dipeptidyl aminopeptidase/acylaminoacyl peptidase